MKRIVLGVLVCFLGCEPGSIDVEERPIVEDKEPGALFDDNGQQVSDHVRLSGAVADDQVLAFLRLRLSSDLAGILWEGNPNPDGSWLWEGPLVSGSHNVRLEVEDASGQLVVSEHVVEVRDNHAPNCHIVFPAPGQYPLDEPVEFRAESSDPEGDDLMRLWSSDQEGTLFEGDAWSLRLKNPGQHLIRFEVVDGFGAACADKVEIHLY
jgi:hypothetical protein